MVNKMKKCIAKVFALFLTIALLITSVVATSAYAVSDPVNYPEDLVKATKAGYYREDGTCVMPVLKNVSWLLKDGKYSIEYTNKDGTIDIYGPNENFFLNGEGNMVMWGDGRPNPKEDVSLKDDDTKINGLVIGKGKILDTGSDKKDFEVSFDHILKKYTGAGGSIVIPDGVEAIASSVFKDRKDITNITIPNSVKYIETNAFENVGLTSVIIPSSVKRIQGFAFGKCANLKNVIIPGNPVCWTGIFLDSNQKLVVYSDSSHVNFYRGYDGLNVKPLSQSPIVKGSLTVDTTSYSLSPKNSYVIGTGIDGYGGTVKASSNNSNTATVTKLGNGKFKVTGVNAGTTSIVFGVYNSGNKQIAHISVLVTVQNGIASSGNATKQTVTF